jgi:hypothetical protein
MGQPSHSLLQNKKDMGQQEQSPLNGKYEQTHCLLHDQHEWKDNHEYIISFFSFHIPTYVRNFQPNPNCD